MNVTVNVTQAEVRGDYRGTHNSNINATEQPSNDGQGIIHIVSGHEDTPNTSSDVSFSTPVTPSVAPETAKTIEERLREQAEPLKNYAPGDDYSEPEDDESDTEAENDTVAEENNDAPEHLETLTSEDIMNALDNDESENQEESNE